MRKPFPPSIHFHTLFFYPNWIHPNFFPSFLSNKQSTGSEHSHTARFPLRSTRGTANPLPPRLPSSFPLSISASHSLSSLPYRIALHAALQRIQHDVNQLIDRHCSSLASLHSYSHRSPSPRSFPRSKTVERGPFSRSGCESRSRTHCILSTRRREMYGRDEDLWTTEKSTKEGKRNVHTADQQTNTIRTTFVCESAEMLF